MKVLFCKNHFAGPMSGADEIVVTYALELKAAGHSTGILLVHAPSKTDPLAARLRAAEVPLNALAASAFTASLAGGRKLAIRAMHACSPARDLIRSSARKLVFDILQRYHGACCKFLRRHRPDLIHVMTPDPGAVMLIRAAHETNIPVIYQEVGIPFHPPGFEEVYERFVSVLPLCAGLAVLSPRLGQELSRVLPHLAPARVVPLISQDHNGASAPAPSETVTFGFAARLEHLKGPLRLLEAFGIAHQTQAQMDLKIAGDGSQRHDLVLGSRRLGLEEKCQLVGVYNTLKGRAQFMHGIDVFVLPSLTEGTPNAIIEAMAHSKPIIANAVGGVPDLVTEDVGILVPANDVKGLASAMARLADDVDLRHRMGLAARKKYEQLFTPNVVLPLLVDFYERVVEEHAAANGATPGSGNGQRPLNKLVHPWFGVNASSAANVAAPIDPTPSAPPCNCAVV
jgi:glycosyltransferase involved in cell wall biosynthesis